MQKDKFKELYDHCQTLTPKIKRNQVINKIKELTGKPVKTMMTTLDISVLRGYFLSATNTDNWIVQQHCSNVIVLARGLNDCWERFVNIKEAMHLLDDDGDLTESKEQFEGLLNEFAAPNTTIGSQMYSDTLALWMTLSCLCPEKDRIQLVKLRSAGQIDDYEIALRLKIPKQYVPLLFRPNYLDIVQLMLP